MSRSREKEIGEELASEITKRIVNQQQVHEFIHRTVNYKTGGHTDFIVDEDGIRSAIVMVERGQPMDIPEGTWRFLDLQSEAGFEFARYALRKQLEQWGVVFQSDHMTLAEAEAKERQRIKMGDPFWQTGDPLWTT
jgi:cupin superfamily acireductone dioxygenase involved in methionine salvage